MSTAMVNRLTEAAELDSPPAASVNSFTNLKKAHRARWLDPRPCRWRLLDPLGGGWIYAPATASGQICAPATSGGRIQAPAAAGGRIRSVVVGSMPRRLLLVTRSTPAASCGQLLARSAPRARRRGRPRHVASCWEEREVMLGLNEMEEAPRRAGIREGGAPGLLLEGAGGLDPPPREPLPQ